MSSRRLVLLRHGRTTWNAVGRWQGQRDAPLDDVGRSQADAAAGVLAALEPEVVVCSDLSRAADTAAPLAAKVGVPAEPDPRLRETSMGAWEGLTRDEIAARFPDEWAAWTGGADVARGGGETQQDVGARMGPALLQAADGLADAGTAVVVSHGAAIRCGVGVLLGLPLDTWEQLHPLGNGRWATLVDGRRGWRLLEYGAGPEGPLR